MIIAETEVKLTLHPIVLFGEADCLTGKASVLMPHSAVVTFYESGIEMLADGGAVQVGVQHGLSTEDDLLANTDDPSLASVLDHLGVEEIGRRFQSWLGKRSA